MRSMIHGNYNLEDKDLQRLLQLHRSSLETSVPVLLGNGYMRYFYEFVVSSPEEMLFIKRRAGEIVSAGIVSLKSEDFERRLILSNTLGFLAQVMLRTFISKGFREYLKRRLVELVKSHGIREIDKHRSPEITHLFTAAERRSQGLGEEIMATIEERMKAMGFSRWYVKTFADMDNRAISFYRRCGYTEVDQIVLGGQRYTVFEKSAEPRL